MFIKLFVDALFHEEEQVRTNAMVFVSDIDQTDDLQRLLTIKFRSALGVKPSSTAPPPSSPFSKKENTITPLAKRALHVLENIEPPVVGQKDFDLQTTIFDIIKFLEKHRKIILYRMSTLEYEYDKIKYINHDIFESAVYALFYMNPRYPNFAKFLAQVVLSGITDRKLAFFPMRIKKRQIDLQNSAWTEVALTTLTQIPSVDNIAIYEMFKKNLYDKNTHNLVVRYGDSYLADMLNKLFDDMAVKFDPNTFSARASAGIIPSIEAIPPVEYKTPEDKNLIRVSPASYAYMDKLKSYRIARSLNMGKFIIDTHTVFPNPNEGIQYMKHLLKTAPSSLEFMRFLIYSLTAEYTAEDIYLRSTAMNIAKGISINEDELELFFKQPKNDSKGEFASEHRRLAMRLWILIDPENPRLKSMLQSAVSNPDFQDIDDIKTEARNFLKYREISSETVLRITPPGKYSFPLPVTFSGGPPRYPKVAKCQTAFGKAR